MEVISAAEAKLYTEENIKKLADKGMQPIMAAIQKAIDQGEFCIYGGGSLHPSIVKLLKELGYKVDCNQRDGYNISWKNDKISYYDERDPTS